MAKRTPRVTDPTRPPASAHFFEVWHLQRREGRTEAGKRFSTYKCKRMTGDAGPDGRVTEHWPVDELSPAAIVKRWGAGRFRIRYLNSQLELVGAADWELAAPPDRGTPLEGAAGGAGDASPASRIMGIAGQLGGASVVELMLLLNDARDSAARQAREESERREARERERDRMFFERFAPHGGGGSAPGLAAAAAPAAVDVGRELALMRRELALTLREETARLRQEILNELPEEPGAETLTDALNGAGVGVVEALGGEVPSLVSDGLAKLRLWLRANGQPEHPQAVLQAIEAVRAAAMAEAQANGVGHEPQS